MKLKYSEITKYVSKNYSSINKIKNIKLIQSNNLNTLNYLISTTSHQYVLRNFIDNSTTEKIEKICKVLSFCKINNVKVLEPIKNIHGKYVDKQYKIFLTKYYNGKFYSGNKKELISLAKNLAFLHKTLKKYKISYNYKLITKEHRILSNFEFKKIKLIIKQKKTEDDFDQRILTNLDQLKKYFKHGNYIHGLINSLDFKKQLIHNDIQPFNIIFHNDSVLTILDFNGMGKAPQIQDIAFASYRFSAYKENNISSIKNKIKSFVKTYSDYNEIDDKQIEYINEFFILKIIQGISRILRKKYFFNANLWEIDFENYFYLLKLANKMNNK